MQVVALSMPSNKSSSTKSPSAGLTATKSNQIGKIYLLESTLIFAAPELHNEIYTDYPISVIVGVDEPLTLDLGDMTRTARGFVVGPGVKRRLQAEHPVVDWLVGLDSPYYRYLYKTLQSEEIVELNEPVIDGLRRPLHSFVEGVIKPGEVHAETCHIFTELFGQPLSESSLDPRLHAILAYLSEALPINPPIEDLAAMVDLSASRLMHLFKEQLGLPIRQYLLWKKIERAALLHSQGYPMLEMAIGAGFYDQAHFTRTVRRMLDLPPSVLTDSRNIQVINAIV